MQSPVFNINKFLFSSEPMGSTIESSIVDIGELSGYCIHAIWTGTPSGVITIEASNDGINFVSQNSQATGGAAGQHLHNVANVHYRYIKVVFTHAASTGNLTVYCSGKQI